MGIRKVAAYICTFAVLVAGADTASVQAATRAKTKAPRDQLAVERRTKVGSTTVSRYAQRVGGYDVLGAEAIISSSGSAERLVLDRTVPRLRKPPSAKVSEAKATKIAREAAKVSEERDKIRSRLAILPKGTGKLVWEVKIPALEPLGDFEVLVDAQSGRVLRKKDRLKNLQTGSAQIYDPNPPVMQGSYVGLADNGNRDSALLTGLRSPVSLQRINDNQSCLSGQFAAAKVVRRRRRRPVCAAGLDWSTTTRSSRNFEALMAYFHVDRFQNYIQQDLGIFDANNRQQLVVANAFKADNAFYSPFTRRIELGKGGVDDGEDADVIIHEYGHAIQDNMIPDYGLSFDSAAMGEGFGDYMAAAASSELSVPVTASDEDGCIADWDAVSYTDPNASTHCLRRADFDNDTLSDFDNFCGNSFHCLGQVWSSALFYLRDDTPNLDQEMDRIALRAHDYMGRSPTFSEAALALEWADEALNPVGTPLDGQGANYTAIHAEMVFREFL